jgi:hypothetical protein
MTPSNPQQLKAELAELRDEIFARSSEPGVAALLSYALTQRRQMEAKLAALPKDEFATWQGSYRVWAEIIEAISVQRPQINMKEK